MQRGRRGKKKSLTATRKGYPFLVACKLDALMLSLALAATVFSRAYILRFTPAATGK